MESNQIINQIQSSNPPPPNESLSLSQVRTLLDSADGIDERFRSALSAFAQKAATRLETLRAEVQETSRALRALSTWLGQPLSAPVEAPFSLISHFVVALEQVRIDASP